MENNDQKIEENEKEEEVSLSNTYKQAAWDSVLDSPITDPKALDKLNVLEKGLEEELVDAKSKGDGKKDVELTRQLMSVQQAKNNIASLAEEGREQESGKESHSYFDEEAASSFVEKNPWVNPKSEHYNADLSSITQNYVENLDEILKKENQGHVIGTKDYFNFIDSEIKDFVESERSKALQENNRSLNNEGISPKVSIRDTISKYKELERVKVPKDRLNLWNKMDVYDDRGRIIQDQRTKISKMNDYKNIVDKVKVGDNNRIRISVPQSFAMPVSFKR